MIGEIENAIAARLKAAGAAAVADGGLGYAYKDISSLPVDVDERLIEYFKTYPAAGTVFGGWKKIDEGRGYAKVRMTFHLVVAAQNARNEAATRMGVQPLDGQPLREVGSYQLITDAVALLLGQDLGLQIGPLMLGDGGSLYTGAKSQGQQISLFWAAFTTDVSIDAINFGGGNLKPFATFHATWDPPSGDPDAPATSIIVTGLDQA